MFIFTKPIHRKGITVLKQFKSLIWMILDKSIFNFKRNIYLCFVYIKPYQGKDLSETIFSELQSDITVYSSLGDILISGDFNSRAGGLADFIQNDSINDNFIDCPLLTHYVPDTPLKRCQLDDESNLNGNLLTNIC
jgi:hypothetical protein